MVTKHQFFNYKLEKTKGQLISKCLLGIFISPKKRKKNQLYYYGTSSRIVFVVFWGELKTLKRHFETNRPLEATRTYSNEFCIGHISHEIIKLLCCINIMLGN